MVEILRSTTLDLKNTYFKVNVLQSTITKKITYECFYLFQGREYHQFNHSPNGLMKRASFVFQKVASVENHGLLQRVLYTFLTELMVMEQHSSSPDQTNIVGNIQQGSHPYDNLENSLPLSTTA
jgi:hypothetical protein